MQEPTDRRVEVDRIFRRALELEGEEREAYLATASAGDPELGAAVERLLGGALETDPWLRPAGALGGPLGAALAVHLEAAEPEDPERAGLPRPGEKVGPYRIRREIGRGGMAVVFEAERADGHFEQRVALKLIRRGFGDGEGLARFRAERQILASMEHPNIARLLDGGRSEAGVPYFAMELVEGLPIDLYCDRRRLRIRERLHLFLEVCRGVEAAHRNLVVHRDLKPSNILVTDTGEVKLLDFGIAKLTEPGEGAPETRTFQRLMTPEYASPEQVRGERITTASDIYQLGLLLYELLVGRRARRLERESLAEVARAVEESPERPSTALSRPLGSGGEEVEATCRARGTHPARLRRELAGDLDNIVLMALRPEPERRYASVAQLAEDVERFLSHRPVLARPDTPGYRLRKLLRRHRLAAAGGLAALSLIVALVVFYTARLARERDREAVAAARAARVSDFLADLFRASNPVLGEGEETTARELLDRGAERIAELAAEPEVQAAMQELIGRSYLRLGHYGAAAPLLEASLAGRRRLHGEAHPEAAKAALALAALRIYQGELDSARALLEPASTALEAELGADAPELGRALRDLGLVYFRSGRLELAEATYGRALAIQERAFGAEDIQVAITASNYASLLRQTGRPARARELEERGLAIKTAAYGERHPLVAETLTNLGLIAGDLGDLEAALGYHRRALDLRRQAFGEVHPDVAASLINLSVVHLGRGERAAAREVLERALEVQAERLGPEHLEVGMARANLARTLSEMGEHTEAAREMEAAHRIFRQQLPPGHPNLGLALGMYGQIEQEAGRPVEARRRFRAALAVFEESLGEAHAHTLEAALRLGEVELELAGPAAAEPWLRRATAGLESLAEGHPLRAEASEALERCLAALEAEP